MNTQLLITTLQEAIHRYYPETGLILHSDQGSQFTSKTFTEYCKKRHIQQSMSRAGCPYDNAVTERYFNTLKHECTTIIHLQQKKGWIRRFLILKKIGTILNATIHLTMGNHLIRSMQTLPYCSNFA